MFSCDPEPADRGLSADGAEQEKFVKDLNNIVGMYPSAWLTAASDF